MFRIRSTASSSVFLILVLFAGCAPPQDPIVGLWHEQTGVGRTGDGVVRMLANGTAEMECFSDGRIHLKDGPQIREFHWRRDPKQGLVIERVINGKTHIVFGAQVEDDRLTLENQAGRAYLQRVEKPR